MVTVLLLVTPCQLLYKRNHVTRAEDDHPTLNAGVPHDDLDLFNHDTEAVSDGGPRESGPFESS